MAAELVEARMFTNLGVCLIPDCIAAYGLGMATIVLGATLITIFERRKVDRANRRRDEIIKDLQSR